MHGSVRRTAVALAGVVLMVTPARGMAAAREQELSTATTVGQTAPAGDQRNSDAPDQLLVGVHVHSSASSGTLPMPQLARLARQSGLDALVLGENLGYEFRYAPAGLRMLGEVRLATETLERRGIARFLESVAEARSAQPDLLLLAGAEVPTYYYWTGSLLRGNLTLHDVQRNVLLVAPVEASPGATHAFFRDVPAVGNRHHRAYGPGSLALLLPGLFCVGAALRIMARPVSRARNRKRVGTASVLFATGAVLLYVNFPFSVPSLAPYSPDTAGDAAEDVLSYARRHGALSYWSMPQAASESRRGLGPLAVQLSTVPYPEVLNAPGTFTGFGGVYADTVTLWEAGNAWDDAILAFQSGRRETTPWIMGESAFHYTGQAGKHIGDVVTVLNVEERTEEAVFAALSEGNSYALRRDRGHPDIRLAEFSLAPIDTVDATDKTQPAPASGPVFAADTKLAGQTLRVSAAEAIELVVRVYDAAGSRTPVDVEIIRNGESHRQATGMTPFEQRWREALPTDDGRAYYRVVVRATRAAYLVSNPIFIERNQ